ncbi:MAG: radical SAM protein [Dehalococcoidia bacterium]|nr:radical SAM protein [Dehalococcoidia bacterium]
MIEAGREYLGELESSFLRFGDVPREVVLKQDMLRLDLQFGEGALAAGKGTVLKSYRLFSHDMVTMEEMSRQESARVPEDLTVKGGPYGLRATAVQVRVSPVSPYLVDLREGQLALVVDGEAIAQVEYPQAPPWYGRSFEDGARYSEVVALTMAGTKPFITAFRNCQFGKGQQCLFCDINSHARQMKRQGRYTVPTPYKKVEQVSQVMEAIFKEQTAPGMRPHSYTISGGAIAGRLADEREDDFYLRYVRAIKERIGSRWSCRLETVAKDAENLKRFRNAGVDIHEPNMEVWDERLFKVLCPGKDRHVGRAAYLHSMAEAVDIFGEGNVTTNLVSGAEMSQPHGFQEVAPAVRSTTEGFDYLMDHGVIPRLTSWCVEPGSPLGHNPPPPLEYFVRIAQSWYEIWRKYDLPPPAGLGPMGPGRALTSNSAFMDVGY